MNVVLAKKGLLLVGQRDSDPSHPHSVVFYNISSPSISDIETIPDLPDSVESQVYANFHKGTIMTIKIIIPHVIKQFTFAFRTNQEN